ncbi:MAG: acetate kinase [Nitrobacter sp.]|uniref:acetate/propionate family kinase n=1 Tax=Nitrobacter sp. TaxID=29420 RepID=UPI00387DF8F5
MQTILALNAGSSSVKFALFDIQASAPQLLFRGMLDRRADNSRFVVTNAAGMPVRDDKPPSDPDADLTISLLERLEPLLEGRELDGVGHRVVHGGPDFSEPVSIDRDVIQRLDQLAPMAPLHQPDCLRPIHSLLSARPGLRQVACFDTAFHRTLSSLYHRLPLPAEFEARGIRRYGFHGLSFEYIAGQFTQPGLRIVAAHLGSGCSVCALQHGRSVNTSMSFTPLDGLMMGTRCGTLDPGVVLYLQQAEQMPLGDIEELLYHKSGLLGVSGLSADMRVLLRSADPKAKEAVTQFCARVAEHIAVMAVALGGMDLLVFTGGIGENSAEVREDVCTRLNWLGVRSNKSKASTAGKTIDVRVIPTNEELVIARQVVKVSERANT